MREYREEQRTVEVVSKVVCNCCGKEILQGEQGKDFLHVEKLWGYFSNKDGRRDGFDICETCYDQWIATFSVAPME